MQFDAREDIYLYHHHPPHSWQNYLLKDSKNSLKFFVSWRAHEISRGVREFSGSSRTSLEKLLILCSENQKKVELKFGFSEYQESFPEWTSGMGEGRVPASYWNADAEEFSRVSIPSFRNADLKQGFTAFARELFGLAELYKVPDGPVKKISFDPGCFRLDLEWYWDKRVSEMLSARYSKLSAFNQFYGTSMGHFPDFSNREIRRMLEKKRPWMAAFDYGWARAQLIQDENRALSQLAIERGVGDIFAISDSGPQNSSAAEVHYRFDPVLTESLPFWVGPQMSSGIANPIFMAMFSLIERIQLSGGRISPLDLFEASSCLDRNRSKLWCVLSTQYLAQASLDEVIKFASGGGHVIFPFGLPKYNEWMVNLKWPTPTQTFQINGLPDFHRLRLDLGSVWTFASQIPFAQGALPLQDISAALLQLLSTLGEKVEP